MNVLHRNIGSGGFGDSWYAASADPVAARPALRGRVEADVCVVGAGYTGLSAAIPLARAGARVVVLEAHHAGWGASGRNGGQVSSGYNMGQIALARRLGRDTARALWDLAEAAKAHLRAQVAALAPEACYRPGVAEAAWRPGDHDALAREAAFLEANYGYDQIALLDGPDFREVVRSETFVGGWIDEGAGHIHPLRYVQALARAAEEAGAVLHDGTEVHRVHRGARVRVQAGQGEVRADHLILAGNGYLPGLVPEVAARVMPINSFICATSPLGDRARSVLARDIAVADSRFVVNYFRLSEDQRLLFGGRAAYSLGFPKDISTSILARMHAMFPQIADVGADFAWGGTLGMTRTRLPAVLRVAPNILSAGGFSGHGVALSGFAGRLMGEAVLGQASRFDTLSLLPGSPFPGGGAARAPLLALAMAWYSLRDRLGI